MDVLNASDRGEDHRRPVVRNPGVDNPARGLLQGPPGIMAPDSGAPVKKRRVAHAGRQQAGAADRQQHPEGGQPGRGLGPALVIGELDELIRAGDKRTIGKPGNGPVGRRCGAPGNPDTERLRAEGDDNEPKRRQPPESQVSGTPVHRRGQSSGRIPAKAILDLWFLRTVEIYAHISCNRAPPRAGRPNRVARPPRLRILPRQQ